MNHFKYLKKPKLDLDHDRKILTSAMVFSQRKLQASPLAGEAFHIVDKPFKAHLNVYFTDKEWDADILVYVTKYPFRARGRDEIWHYSEREYHADTLVYPVDKPYLADLKVCLVENEYQARWRHKKKLKARRKQKQ